MKNQTNLTSLLVTTENGMTQTSRRVEMKPLRNAPFAELPSKQTKLNKQLIEHLVKCMFQSVYFFLPSSFCYVIKIFFKAKRHCHCQLSIKVTYNKACFGSVVEKLTPRNVTIKHSRMTLRQSGFHKGFPGTCAK